MKHKEKFISPARTLELINLQAHAPENVNFAKKYFPKFKSGAEIWDEIKPLVQFKADPAQIDTIQGISTLFSNTKNIHKLSGLGDCDCFTAALASIAIANKLPFEYIIQGNTKPSHIAIKIGNTILDLTNPIPDYLRKYNFTKYIKPMFVALADNDEMATELSEDFNLDFGRPNFRRALQVAKKFNPVSVAVRTSAKYSPQALAVRALQRQANRVMRVPTISRKMQTVNRLTNRAGGTILRNVPPGARARIMLTKRQLKRRGFGDSEAELLAIQNFSDDFGRRKISLKRGLQNVGRAAMKAAPILLPVAGGALNLIAPGVGTKTSALLQRGIQRAGGARTITAGRSLLQNLRRPSGASTAPAVLPEMQSSDLQPMPAPMQVMQEPTFAPGTFVTQPVPITAPKINPMLLAGAGALAILLLTRKK
jgi:hypothetical protein